MLVAQPSLFDSSRAPEGKHTLWAYCHVPNGSTIDMTERIEDQIERFAPGFRSRILARSLLSPAQLESRNANLVGGDINGGAATLTQLFTRPTIHTYRTPLDNIYICSSSTSSWWRRSRHVRLSRRACCTQKVILSCRRIIRMPHS